MAGSRELHIGCGGVTATRQGKRPATFCGTMLDLIAGEAISPYGYVVFILIQDESVE
jgi:hypothetical protein